MLIGAMNNPHKPLSSEIEKIGEMSFDIFELTLEAPEATPEKVRGQRKEMDELVKSYNFGLLGHMPWYFSVAHPYPTIQKAIREESTKIFECAKELGIDKMTIHTEFLFAVHKDRKKFIDQTIGTLGSISDECDGMGIKLLVENFNDQSFTVSDFERLMKETKVGMTLDIGHANMVGKNGDGIREYLKMFEKRIEHVHVHDNFGKEDNHLPLGVGYINWEQTVKELKKFYDKTITIEVHAKDQDYLKVSKDKLEILWYGKEKFEDNQKYLMPAASGSGKKL